MRVRESVLSCNSSSSRSRSLATRCSWGSLGSSTSRGAVLVSRRGGEGTLRLLARLFGAAMRARCTGVGVRPFGRAADAGESHRETATKAQIILRDTGSILKVQGPRSKNPGVLGAGNLTVLGRSGGQHLFQLQGYEHLALVGGVQEQEVGRHLPLVVLRLQQLLAHFAQLLRRGGLHEVRVGETVL